MAAENGEKPGRSELAQDRTDLAEDRTVLAHERSFAGWVRTGMAAIGIGLGLNALFRSLDPTWVPKAIATGFFIIAIFVFISAQQRACRIIARLEAHKVSALKPVRIRMLTASLVLLSLALAASIWLLTPG